MSSGAAQEAIPPRAAEVDACWRRIGVRGDQSCPELPRHVHCQNCPQYGAAGRAILDARAPEDLYTSLSEQIAIAHTPAEGETQSILVFSVGAERFGIATRACVEVAESRPIHSLPHRRDGAVLGIASVRGTLLICISLAAILHASPPARAQERSKTSSVGRLLVIGCEYGPVGVPVDEIHGIVRYGVSDLKPVPLTVASSSTRHTQGVLALDAHVIGVLDSERLAESLARALA